MVAIEVVEALEIVVVLMAAKLVGAAEVFNSFSVLRWAKHLEAESWQFRCWAVVIVGWLKHLKWLKHSEAIPAVAAVEGFGLSDVWADEAVRQLE